MITPVLPILYKTVCSSIDYKNFKFPVGGWEPGAPFLNIEEYYKFLAFMVRDLKPKRILELGRRFGNSLYALSFFLDESSILDSYDIVECGNVVSKPNVNIKVYNGNVNSIRYFEYDFIFVDVNGGGSLELQIHTLIHKSGYKGLVAWDDVGSKWCPDTIFWNAINTEKLKLPLHGQYFGFTRHV